MSEDDINFFIIFGVFGFLSLCYYCSIFCPAPSGDGQTQLRAQARPLTPEEQARIAERVREQQNRGRGEWDFGSRPRTVEAGQWQQQQVDIEAGLRRQQEQDDILVSEAIFSEALENKEQQTILVPSQIFDGKPTQQDLAQQDDEGKDDEEENQHPDEDPAPFNWALISARSVCQSERRSIHLPSDRPFNWALVSSIRNPSDQRADECKANEDSNDDDESVILKNETPTPFMSGLWFFHPRQEKKLVGGICAICLDEMQAGETVVWSETESCPHIFHKKCLVTFLAHNKQAQMRLPPHRRQLDRHPCPTCRQQFVTISPYTQQ